MPADFDDEEIDEEAAFNEEDNHRFGDFFSNFAAKKSALRGEARQSDILYAAQCCG